MKTLNYLTHFNVLANLQCDFLSMYTILVYLNNWEEIVIEGQELLINAGGAIESGRRKRFALNNLGDNERTLIISNIDNTSIKLILASKYLDLCGDMPISINVLEENRIY
jgi:hypothetical protein